MPTGRRIHGLDGLRAVSIFLVLMGHQSEADGFPGWLRAPRLWDGALGVRIFFGISGFLISRLLLADEASLGAIDFSRFYSRRARRILPPVAVFLAVLFVLGAICFRDVAVGLFFVRNMASGPLATAHLWSLAVEEQFYLVWPAVLYLTSPRARIRLLMAVIAIKPFWLYALHRYSYAQPFRTDVHLDALAIGALVAMRPMRVPFVPSMLIGACAIAAAQSLGGLHFGWLAREWLLDGGIGLVLLAAIAAEPTRVLCSPSVTWLGRISYSTYLWQQPMTFWLPWPLGIVAATAMGLAAYILVERPAASLTQRRIAPSGTC